MLLLASSVAVSELELLRPREFSVLDSLFLV